MKIEHPEDIKIGHWWSICCHLDLYEIQNQSDLTDVQEMVQSNLTDDDWPHVDIWEAQGEALLEIRSRWRDSEVITEIDMMLAKIPNEN